LGDLALNASRVFTIGYDVPSNAGLANIVSQLTVGANVVDSNPNNNTTGQFTTRVFEEAALSLAMTADQNTILAGSPDQLTYNLVVSSGGPSQARTARITDTLPSSVNFVSVQIVQGGGAGANCSAPVGRVVSCLLGNITACSTTTVRIKVTAKASAPTSITNMATVRSLTEEINLANNTASLDTTVQQSADMAITKVASPKPSVIAGREITYTLTYTNKGFSDTSNVKVIDALPQNVTYVRSTLPSGASCTAGGGGAVVTCNFPGALLAGQSRSFNLVALVKSIVPAGTITNTARILSSRLDPNPANDVTPAVATKVTLLADLTVSKSVNKAKPDIFEVVTYTVKLRNNGPSQSYNVEVEDLLPQDMHIVGTPTTTRGTYDTGSGIWTVGTLPVKAAGQEDRLVIRAFVDEFGGGEIKDNKATASSTVAEPAPGLANTANVTLTAQSADIQVSVTSPPALATRVIAGKRLTYTVAIKNNGPTLARSVVLTDLLPASVFLVSTGEPSGRLACADLATIKCNVGDMAAGITLNYTVVVTRALKGVITNTVTVGSLTPDIVPANNKATH